MNKSDQWVIITIGLLILLHLAVLVIGYYLAKIPYLAAVLNLAIAVSIILYRAILQIQHRSFEGREIIVLLFEVAVISSAVFFIAAHQRDNWLKIFQFLVFGIHLLLLIGALIFMLTFKMNKVL